MNLVSHSVTTLTLSSSSSSSSFALPSNPSSWLDNILFSLDLKLLGGLRIHAAPSVVNARGSVILKASKNIDGTVSDAPEASSESDEENAQMENFPLDPKLQLKLEHKMKMKFGKKIRLRRKKLDRKRRLRKKGCWPPSKM